MKKTGLWCGIAALVLGLVSLPALAQFDGQPRFKMPVDPIAANGEFVLEWDDLRPGAVNPGLVSFTWFYAKAAAGAERTRITTILRDDFTAFRANWQAHGPFGFDWDVKANRKRQYLQGPNQPGSSSLVSNFQIAPDSVVGVLVRPSTLRPQWGIELRYQGKGESLEFRHDGNKLKILECGEPIVDNIHINLPGARQWAWYEIGLETRARRDVEIRIRVLNEERTALLGQFNHTHRLRNPKLRAGGLIALSGPADFGELYVDPWSARWADDRENRLRWDTSMVENGDYVLVAEVCDDRRVPRQIATNFRISVRNPNRAAHSN